MKSIQQMQDEVVTFCNDKGWSGPGSVSKTFGDCMALLTSEVSEALEAYRDKGDPELTWYTYTVEVDHVKFKGLTEEQVETLTGSTPFDLGLEPKMEGVPSEFADIFIRLLDDCDRFGIDLEAAFEEKMAHNNKRPFRHGGKML